MRSVESNLKYIGLNIKSLRKEQGYLIEEFAKKINCPTKTVLAWESGSKLISFKNLFKVMNFFNSIGIPACEIFSGL